ncbi:MAG: type 1 glutamine amidotransferase [Myxococcota bacterium]
MSSRLPRIALLQARLPSDPILHQEVDCFVHQTGLPRDAFRLVNLTQDDLSDPQTLTDADVVMVGGSGEFSVVQSGFAWHEPMLELMREVVRRGLPMFASCFGHQALAQALGGTLRRDHEGGGEIGTLEVALTAAGRADQVFGQLPERFPAQLGHLDEVTVLPTGAINLASSAKCAVQAIRMEGTSIISTQFHPELTMEAELERWLSYISNYKSAEETPAEAEARARATCTPSPDSSRLLRIFLRDELGYDVPDA